MLDSVFYFLIIIILVSAAVPNTYFRYTFEKVKPPIMATYKVANNNPGLSFAINLEFFLEQKISFEVIEVNQQLFYKVTSYLKVVRL